MNNVSFVIPYSDETIRNYLKDFVIERLKKMYPESEIILGIYNLKPFSRGRAINIGAEKATRDILFIMDADFIFDRGLVEKSVELIEGNAPWVIPFNYVHYLEEDLTQEVLNMPYDFTIAGRNMLVKKHLHKGLGSMCCLKKDDFERIGGFDENIIGWGYEDNVFSHIANTLLGGYKRIEYPILHLWHPYVSYYKNEEILEVNKKYFEKVEKIKDKNDMLSFLESRYKNE